MKKVVLLAVFLFFSGVSRGQICFSGEINASAMLGESATELIGINAKMIYFMNEWTGVYAGGGANRSTSFNGQVEVVAVNGLITPSSMVKNTASKATVADIQVGIRRYVLGDSFGDRKRKYGLYVDALFSLWITKVTSEVPVYDPLQYESPIVQKTEGQFASYIGGVVVGFDKPIGVNYWYSELGVGGTFDQANRFVVDVTWPFYCSFSLGMRFNVSNY